LNIIYSRDRYDFRSCDCKSVFVDGGNEYHKVSGDIENINWLKIDSLYLLEHILHYDYNYSNKASNKYPKGYHGKFVIKSISSKEFYNKLIIDGEVIYE